MEVVGLNFSSATSPELLLKTMDHYCVYNKTPNGIVLATGQLGKWLIMFCDEINLPDMDKYGTPRYVYMWMAGWGVSICGWQAGVCLYADGRLTVVHMVDDTSMPRPCTYMVEGLNATSAREEHLYAASEA